jgi:6-pyruvoyltetrahydropterin/6-carboxytetrahydropterin synthase
MYRIAKEFSFSASHVLEGLAPGHPCAQLHGHNYVVEIVLGAEELDGAGFVVDYLQLAPVREMIDAELDHRHLNDVLPGATSAEALARWVYDRARQVLPAAAADRVLAVRVRETPKTWAEWAPAGR